MVNIAVAGGTGKVGKTILEVLKSQTRHKPFLLSRKNAPSNDDSVTSVTVDYSDAASLTEALEYHEIHTVICCLPYEGNALEVGQGNLIKASEASVHTKRFVPSAFGINYPKQAVKELPVLKHYFQAIETLRQSSLEWTIFQNGCFLDYWGQPHIKSYLRPSPFGIDIAGKVAAIPGDGDTPFTVTYSFDVAKYVVAALDLDEWPETTRIAGDIITWKGFVELAESTTGSKFEVFYDPIDKLERGELTELPSQIPCYATFPKPQFQWFMSIFSKWTADEVICHIPGELNAKLPDIQPMTVKAMLETYWKV